MSQICPSFLRLWGVASDWSCLEVVDLCHGCGMISQFRLSSSGGGDDGACACQVDGWALGMTAGCPTSRVELLGPGYRVPVLFETPKNARRLRQGGRGEERREKAFEKTIKITFGLCRGVANSSQDTETPDVDI